MSLKQPTRMARCKRDDHTLEIVYKHLRTMNDCGVYTIDNHLIVQGKTAYMQKADDYRIFARIQDIYEMITEWNRDNGESF